MNQTRTKNKAFVILPRFLLGMDISDTTKLIYALLLDRSRLSDKRDEFKDENGRAFVFYTIDQLAEDTGRAQRTVKKSLAVLESEGLIQRVRQGFGYASKIYVIMPDTEENTEQERSGEDDPDKGAFFSPSEGKSCTNEVQKVSDDKCRIFTYRGADNAPLAGQDLPLNNNKYNNTKKSYTKRERVRASPRGRYENVLITDEEYSSLKDSYMKVDEYIEKLSRYIRIHGKKYDCHDAVLRGWLEEDGHRKQSRDYYDDWGGISL